MEQRWSRLANILAPISSLIVAADQTKRYPYARSTGKPLVPTTSHILSFPLPSTTRTSDLIRLKRPNKMGPHLMMRTGAGRTRKLTLKSLQLKLMRPPRNWNLRMAKVMDIEVQRQPLQLNHPRLAPQALKFRRARKRSLQKIAQRKLIEIFLSRRSTFRSLLEQIYLRKLLDIHSAWKVILSSPIIPTIRGDITKLYWLIVFDFKFKTESGVMELSDTYITVNKLYK